MELFSTRFYAVISLVVTIISLAITVSVAHAQKASIGKPSPLSEAHKNQATKADKPHVAKSSKNKEPRCVGQISADFISRGRSANKLNAIRAWRAKVVSTHGDKYKHWSVSQGHSVSCFREAGKAKCTALARPCRIIKWNMKKAKPAKQGVKS